jgi:hypothetical protein
MLENIPFLSQYILVPVLFGNKTSWKIHRHLTQIKVKTGEPPYYMFLLNALTIIDSAGYDINRLFGPDLKNAFPIKYEKGIFKKSSRSG